MSWPKCMKLVKVIRWNYYVLVSEFPLVVEIFSQLFFLFIYRISLSVVGSGS